MRQHAHKLIDFIFDLGEKAKKQPIIPDEAKEHFRQARKEGMSGIRVCMDHWKMASIRSKEKGSISVK